MSSASSRDSKRVQAAILRNTPEPETSASRSQAAADTDSANADRAEETAANDTASSEEQISRSASRSRSSLALQRHHSHSMDNRPVDPSPIRVSHTVRMAGQRPIGASPSKGPIDFSKSQTILNRPIAPNTTADDVAMVEYLD